MKYAGIFELERKLDYKVRISTQFTSSGWNILQTYEAWKPQVASLASIFKSLGGPKLCPDLLTADFHKRNAKTNSHCILALPILDVYVKFMFISFKIMH